MPSPAVIAKDALVSFLDGLIGRLATHGGAPVHLPTWSEWVEIRKLAHDALRLKGLKIELEHFLTWKDLARLEKAYRPHLKFAKWYEPFMDAVEAGASPYAQLQAAYWGELVLERRKPWAKRCLKYQVIDWLINEVRVHDSFLRWNHFPSYERFKNNCANFEATLAGTEEMWAMAGKLLSKQMGQGSASTSDRSITTDAWDAKKGYDVFIEFQKTYHQWCLQQPGKGSGPQESPMQMMMLDWPKLEERLVMLRHYDEGAPGYRIAEKNDGKYLQRGHVPTLKGAKVARAMIVDTERKRKSTGSKPRKAVFRLGKQDKVDSRKLGNRSIDFKRNK